MSFVPRPLPAAALSLAAVPPPPPARTGESMKAAAHEARHTRIPVLTGEVEVEDLVRTKRPGRQVFELDVTLTAAACLLASIAKAAQTSDMTRRGARRGEEQHTLSGDCLVDLSWLQTVRSELCPPQQWTTQAPLPHRSCPCLLRGEARGKESQLSFHILDHEAFPVLVDTHSNVAASVQHQESQLRHHGPWRPHNRIRIGRQGCSRLNRIESHENISLRRYWPKMHR